MSGRKIRYAGATTPTPFTPVTGAPDIISNRVLDLMADGRERTVGDIADKLRVDPTTLSMHLRALRKRGLLDYDVVYGTRLWRQRKVARRSS